MNSQGFGRFSRVIEIIKESHERVFIDIGANKGEWTRQLLSIFPEADVFMIEANERHTGALTCINKPFQITLLSSDSKTQVPFYTAPYTEGTGDSMYRENTFHYDNAQVKMLVANTLDDVLAAANPEFGRKIALMKLDVQGAELDVLTGGKNSLERTDALIVETAMFAYNAKAPLFSHVVEFLEKRDFVVIDIIELIEMPCKLPSQADLLFAKRGGFLHSYYNDTIKSSLKKK